MRNPIELRRALVQATLDGDMEKFGLATAGLRGWLAENIEVRHDTVRDATGTRRKRKSRRDDFLVRLK